MPQSLTIASWNINSIRQRLPHLINWLNADDAPDIICLQETKCQDHQFPFEEVEIKGYKAYINGQKTFNGVAILSRYPIENITTQFSSDDKKLSDPIQARLIAGDVLFKNTSFHLINVYCPNGNPVDSEKYPYKIRWMDALESYIAGKLEILTPTLLCGDFNIIPEDRDCHNPKAWEGDALFLPQSQAIYHRLTGLGMTDALRATTDEKELYTFWDYQGGAFQKNNGIRIDHHLLCPQMTDRLKRVEILKHFRAQEKPSDHVPIVVECTL